MNKKDLETWNNLYLSVYGEEQLNEAPTESREDRLARYRQQDERRYEADRQKASERNAPKVSTSRGKGGQVTLDKAYPSQLNQQKGVTRYQEVPGQSGRVVPYFTPNNNFQNTAGFGKYGAPSTQVKTPNPPGQTPPKKEDPLTGIKPVSQDKSGSSDTPNPNARPAAQKPSGPVLSKRNGVEGTGVGADFKEKAFSAAEKSRYASVAAQNAASSTGTPKVAPSSSSSSSTSSAPTPAVGKLGNTSFDIRTPTRQEMDVAKRAGGGEAGVKAAVASNQPTTGPEATDAQKSEAGAAAKAAATAPAKPTTPTTPTQPPKKPTIMQTQSYKWPSKKEIGDIASAYASIYEGKGDGNLANNYPPYDKVTRGDVIAGALNKDQEGGKKKKKVKNKSYNEDIEYIEERDEGKPGLMFKKIAKKAAAKYGSVEAGNRVAGAIRKKVLANEATRMAELGYNETEIRNKIAKSTGGGEAADRATELENRPTFGDKSKQAARGNLARKQRGDFRRTTSSDYGLRLGAHQSDDPAVKAMQAARGKQRSALTPNEKKMLNREAYETYELVASYLLENNFATTVEDANVIINNMSENWFESIIEEKKPLPVGKMKAKEKELSDRTEKGMSAALRTPVNSPERTAARRTNNRAMDIEDVRRSVATRGGKRPLHMPEVGRFKPKDED